MNQRTSTKTTIGKTTSTKTTAIDFRTVVSVDVRWFRESNTDVLCSPPLRKYLSPHYMGSMVMV